MFLSNLSFFYRRRDKWIKIIILGYWIAHTCLWVTSRWWRFRMRSTISSTLLLYRFFVKEPFPQENYVRFFLQQIVFFIIIFSCRMYPRLSMLANVSSAGRDALVRFHRSIKFAFVFNRVIQFYIFCFVVLVILDSSAHLSWAQSSDSLLDLIIKYFQPYVAFP